MTASRLEEERRLMYVGITRARAHPRGEHAAPAQEGPSVIAGVPSRFIAEMKLHETRRRRSIRAKS